MMRSPITALGTTVLLALATAPPRARAQSLARQVAAAHSDTVEFHFAARPGVCGDGRTVIAFGDHMFMGHASMNGAGVRWRQRCVPGPVRVVLTMRDGQLHRVHTAVGTIPPTTRTRPGALGDHHVRNDDDEVRTAAVFGLSQLRHHQGIPPLIQVARENPRPHVREQAVFWLSQSDDPRALAFLEEVLRHGAQRQAR